MKKHIKLTESGLKRVIKESVKRLINEWEYKGNRESTNVDDRRLTPAQEEAASICLDCYMRLRNVYNFKHRDLIRNIYKALATKNYRILFHRLATLPHIPYFGDTYREYCWLETMLSKREYNPRNPVLVGPHGVADWLFTVNAILDEYGRSQGLTGKFQG